MEMNLNKILLEAVHRGIKFALDDFDDELVGLQTNSIKDTHYTKEYLDLMNNYVVDLGLPSKTLWCKYNLGCDYELLNNHPENTKPKDWCGNYYAWGEIEPNKSKYTWISYKYGKKFDKLTKYNTDEYAEYFDDESEILVNIDNLTQLQPEDDAVTQNMHLYNYKFYTPTKELFEELKKYTTYKPIKNYIINNRMINHLNGIELTSKLNGNKLFIPASGYYSGEYFACNTDVMLWSADINIDEPYTAWEFDFDGKSLDTVSLNRCHGLAIRPVIKI